MLTKSQPIDQITVLENGIILWRVVTRIQEDGVTLSESFWRGSLIPGQSLAGIPEKVASVATLSWTPDVVAEYKATVAANLVRQKLEEQV